MARTNVKKPTPLFAAGETAWVKKVSPHARGVLTPNKAYTVVKESASSTGFYVENDQGSNILCLAVGDSRLPPGVVWNKGLPPKPDPSKVLKTIRRRKRKLKL